jgi:dolichyl-phosphate beta-glucosyltransferase
MIAAGTNTTGPVFLSVVIPAYNEAGKIKRDLERLFAYLRQQPYAAEALVVDDGSADRTAEIARGSAGPGQNLRVLGLDRNRGKGRAVKTGVMAARGRYILVADAGSCVPYENLERGLGLLEAGACDVALGSRAAAGAVIRRRQPFHRRLGAWVFRRILCAAMGLRSIADTQCGFKLFERDAALAIFSRSRVNGFMFDVETVLNARKLGLRLAEFPVDWTNDPDTRLCLVRGSLRNMKDLIRLRLGI